MLPIVEIGVDLTVIVEQALEQNAVAFFFLQEQGFGIDAVTGLLPEASVTQQSILSSVQALFNSGDYAPAVIIFLFSVFFPIVKQIVLALAIFAPTERHNRASRLMSAVHRWAMIDVFVVAIAITVLSTSSGWAADVREGFFFFLGYFFLAGILMMLLKRDGSILVPSQNAKIAE